MSPMVTSIWSPPGFSHIRSTMSGDTSMRSTATPAWGQSDGEPSGAHSELHGVSAVVGEPG